MKVSKSVFTLILICTAFADAEDLTDTFMKMSFEELLDVNVTTVSKRKERLKDSSAAVFILTNDDIKHSGATSIPELLRMVPGLEVARVRSDAWAVSARGFRDYFANKLLILIDGRNVYNPLFAGTYWDVQDYVLDDIERIEVIRGSGGSLWGANAVNGVINIITKTAAETPGSLVTVLGGNEDQGQIAIRQGFPLGENGAGRVYTKFTARDSSLLRDGDLQANDDWRQGRAGFRSDWTESDDRVTLHGDFYSGLQNEGLLLPSFEPPEIRARRSDYRNKGGNLVFRWEREASELKRTSVQGYVDYIDREGLDIGQERVTLDLEAESAMTINDTNLLLLGAGYRNYIFDIEDVGVINLERSVETFEIWNAFFQYENLSFNDALKFTAGTKLTHNDYSGFEVQPTARLRYTLSSSSSLWAAFSRAVRTPSLSERDIRVDAAIAPGGPGGNPVLIRLQGNPEFDSEVNNAFEFGFRTQLTSESSFSASFFWNEYDNLSATEAQVPGIDTTTPIPVFAVPILINNDGHGRIFGGEISAVADLKSWWRLHAWYAYQQLNFTGPDGDSTLENRQGESPQHKAFIRSQMTIGQDWSLDTFFRYVDSTPTAEIPAYLEADLRLAWQMTPQVEVSFVGRNLINSAHPEFVAEDRPLIATEVERAFLGMLRLTF